MIEIEGVSFSYRTGKADAVPALRDLNLDIEPGQFVAIIGHNGSGKSTLVKLLSAVLYPSEGEIWIDGIPVREENQWEIRQRVAVVFQDPDDQLIMNRVADDVAFGPENLGLPREEIGERAEFALRALGLEEIGGRLIEDLSPGQKQRVAIAGALAMRPHFLILDEPTSLLPSALAGRLISTVRDLNRREGMGVLHVTHSMSEAALFDRVVVLDDGRKVMDGAPAEVFRRVEELREIGLDVPLAASLAHRGFRPVTPIIELRNFRYTYLEGTPRANEAVRDVSLRIGRGERVAIVGATQSGKSTLVDSFAHLLRLQRGQVFYEGEDIAAPGYDRGALRRKVGIVFQRPDSQLIEDVVGADVAFGPTAAGLPADETRARVEESLDALGLPYQEFRLRYVHALSGGQRRRVAIAGVLAMHTPVLVLDEPMAGLDPRGRKGLLELLIKLQRDRELTLVLCSASLTDASLLCDRFIILDRGTVVMDGPVREVLREADRLAELDITLPEPVVGAREMQKLFPDFPTDLLTEDELETELLARLGP